MTVNIKFYQAISLTSMYNDFSTTVMHVFGDVNFQFQIQAKIMLSL